MYQEQKWLVGTFFKAKRIVCFFFPAYEQIGLQVFCLAKSPSERFKFS